MARGRKKPERYRKKRRLRLLYQLLSGFAILGAVIAGCILFFQVEHVVVEGNQRYPEEQILAVAAVEDNANLLLLPTRAISERLEQGLRYVDTVQIKREFPTTVRIVVDECLPMAAIQAEGKFWIIDENGKVLEGVDEGVASRFIKVDGIHLVAPQLGQKAQVAEENGIIFSGLCGVLSALREQDMYQNVSWIDLSRATEIDMGYLGRFTVRLPATPEYNENQKRNEGYSRKISILKETLLYLDEADRGTIDLRNSNSRFIPD